MDLLTAGLWGYRRFAHDGPNMDLIGSPIAVVGANEAGKTSFLRALLHLNDDGAFQPVELTRRSDGKVCVRALFALDADDLAELSHLHTQVLPRLLTVFKREGGEIHYKFDRPPERDLTLRRKALAMAEKVRKGRRRPDDDEALAQLDSIIEILSRDGTLPSSEIEQLRQLSEWRENYSIAASVEQLIASLEKLAAQEEEDDPAEEAAEILLERRPRFLWFDEDWRELESEFNLAEPPSPPMAALLDLAGLDLGELRDAVAANDQARVAEIQEATNAGFAALFGGRWRQANVRVQIQVNADVVHVFARNASGRLIPIAERSAGLRQFLALLAFVETKARGREVVLLIDEAERHLHYDAQADLISIFTRQAVVQKIIYTTHSAGCLPSDLGTGIRVIEAAGDVGVPPEDWEHSQISNAFWGSSGAGFSPLLLAMGASTFAFSATRRAVIAEGISDAILLPTLLREAAELARLDFQIAPGIASAGPARIAELSDAAARVAYLVDGDEGGLRNRDKLVEAEVDEARIVVLGGGNEPLAVEDLISLDAYAAAVAEELELRAGQAIAADALPAIGRKKAVDTWCEEQGVAPPSERVIAHRIIDAHRKRLLEGEPVTLFQPERRALLAALHRTLNETIG